MKKLILLFGILILATSCNRTVIDPPMPSGLLFGHAKANFNCRNHGEAGCSSVAQGKPIGGRSGKACAHSILGIVQFGDMSLKKAAAQGNILEVISVDYSMTNALGSVYVSRCLLVNGE